jgi:hypothetical protein
MSRDARMWEARSMWEMFAGARHGEAVMDGSGQVLQFDAGARVWRGGGREYSPLRVAQALCPDLAQEFALILEEQA